MIHLKSLHFPLEEYQLHDPACIVASSSTDQASEEIKPVGDRHMCALSVRVFYTVDL